MQETKQQFRQGDVWIERVESVPTAATARKPKRRITLALGEATGHHHDLETADPADWWKQSDGEQFVRVGPKGGTVTHQEHAPICLPEGTYRVTRQREYSPQEIRNVAD